MEAMMTFEERKQECIANGIVPGVTIRCAVMVDFGDEEYHGVVQHVSQWRQADGGGVICGVDNRGGEHLFAYSSLFDRYATVITPAEPSEVDRLRALEAEVIKVWTEDGGSVQMHTPIAWFRVLRLIPSLNQDEPTDTTDQQ